MTRPDTDIACDQAEQWNCYILFCLVLWITWAPIRQCPANTLCWPLEQRGEGAPGSRPRATVDGLLSAR